MRFQVETKDDVEDSSITAARRALKGRTIKTVSAVENRPGGPNNDCLTLGLDDGSRVSIAVYSGDDIYVTTTTTNKGAR